jgi:hypothetical protein
MKISTYKTRDRSNPSQKMELAPGPNLGKSTSEMHSTLMTAMGDLYIYIYIHIYMCVCIYIYIYMYIINFCIYYVFEFFFVVLMSTLSTEPNDDFRGCSAGVIFFLGANGGLVLSLVQDKPITESVHFTTAMIGFAMLAIQGSITKAFVGENAQVARTAHAFFGTGRFVCALV